LVGPDHKARAIWDLTGQLDLSGFLKNIRSSEGKAGSPAWDPRLLLSVWLYSYSEQVGSAREIARLMEYEPGLMWLCGLGEVNHHTLSDFRAEHEKELKQLMAELLGMLSKEGIVKLELVAHDGTKIRAQAGADTFRREKTLEKETAAARERLERMKQAAEELGKVRAGKARAEEREQARVSLSEPEARIMKHGDGSIAPSYNVQLSTDAAHKVIVGMELTQCSSDSGSLAPAMDEVRNVMGRYPEAAVADGGFTNRESIAEMQTRAVPFYGSLSTVAARQAGAMKAAGIDPAFGPTAFTHDEEKRTLQCPAGKYLTYLRESRKRGDIYWQYQAERSDCEVCANQRRCCPPGAASRLISIRLSENAEVKAFRGKMDTPEAKSIYRQRGPTAEFPNCWIKEKLGLRKFRLRGMAKARVEALWAVLTYNVQQWARLCWKTNLVATAA